MMTAPRWTRIDCITGFTFQKNDTAAPPAARAFNF